mmetsp:Transcript_10210/g.22462  ORF Transcript_10210/g.22462 Transcript_10210/m.22462 type:complete len:611 (+) Transcript_10210:365-2197(+)|eukprot:CAMPEP_0168731568 /NCGR_PEP_ID=MMETSP0724-20121128/7328_1 /TAXON_ID=265536 /ORGANISM="Amphiprora sp., Strain CCMP467" /LENGTH=610 /DNA_ID=CAMNT_0008778571 /DNA_START=261 /DNA_END=2093 /DNA_ORIENTATION=-
MNIFDHLGASSGVDPPPSEEAPPSSGEEAPLVLDHPVDYDNVRPLEPVAAAASYNNNNNNNNIKSYETVEVGQALDDLTLSFHAEDVDMDDDEDAVLIISSGEGEEEDDAVAASTAAQTPWNEPPSPSLQLKKLSTELEACRVLKDTKEFEDPLASPEPATPALVDENKVTVDEANEEEDEEVEDVTPNVPVEVPVSAQEESTTVKPEHESTRHPNNDDKAPLEESTAEKDEANVVDAAVPTQPETKPANGMNRNKVVLCGVLALAFTAPLVFKSLVSSPHIESTQVVFETTSPNDLPNTVEVETAAPNEFVGSIPSVTLIAASEPTDELEVVQNRTFQEDIKPVTFAEVLVAEAESVAIEAEESVAHEPIVQESSVEESISEKPVMEEAIVEEPVVDHEPVVEHELVVQHEPAVQEPVVVQEPVEEEPVAAVQEQAVQEPAVALIDDVPPTLQSPEEAGESLVTFYVVMFIALFGAGSAMSAKVSKKTVKRNLRKFDNLIAFHKTFKPLGTGRTTGSLKKCRFPEAYIRLTMDELKLIATGLDASMKVTKDINQWPKLDRVAAVYRLYHKALLQLTKPQLASVLETKRAYIKESSTKLELVEAALEAGF